MHDLSELSEELDDLDGDVLIYLICLPEVLNPPSFLLCVPPAHTAVGGSFCKYPPAAHVRMM